MNPQELVREWGRRALVAQIGHYRTAIKLETRHRWLGVIVVSLNAVVGTAMFASLSDNLDAILGAPGGSALPPASPSPAP